MRGLTVVQRFDRHVVRTPECWLWTGAKASIGYGQFMVNGKRVYAHRFAFNLYHGGLKGDAVICHRCDNPGCVNPEHLFQGTQKDNIRDAIQKGRFRQHLHRHFAVGAERGCAISAQRRREALCCEKGHPWNSQNTMIAKKTGARRCRICFNSGRRRLYEAHKTIALTRGK